MARHSTASGSQGCVDCDTQLFSHTTLSMLRSVPLSVIGRDFSERNLEVKICVCEFE